MRLLGPTQFFGAPVVTYDGPADGSASELSRTTGNHVVTKIGYDKATLRPTYVKTILPDSTLAQDLLYSYDAVGNITSITDNVLPAQSQMFTYDN